MATSFVFSVDFIDSDLSRFISSVRLPAVIYNVHGVVETRRPDHKNAQYTKIIKEGDVLLSKSSVRWDKKHCWDVIADAVLSICFNLADDRLAAKAFSYCSVDLSKSRIMEL